VVEPKAPVLEFTVARVNALVPAVLVASPVNAGSLAAATVPLERFVAFKDVKDDPEPLGLKTSVPITKPRLVLAVDAEVKSERLFVLRTNEVVSIVAAEAAADVADASAELAEVEAEAASIDT
jgi:hypothetical protein